MSLKAHFVLYCGVLIGISVLTLARNITECDNQASQGYYINNRFNCSYGIIYCNGENSQFCIAQASCDESYDCPMENTAETLPNSTMQPLPVTTPAPSSTASPTNSTAALPDVRHLCTNGVYKKFPYPYNCNYYYQCINGYLLVQQCPFGVTFNVANEACAGLMRGNANCTTHLGWDSY